MRAAFSFFIFFVVLAGCGRMAAGTAGSAGGADRILSEDLRGADSEGLTVLQLVQRLRPQWLRGGRGATSLGTGPAARPWYARVVLNGVPHGSPENLFDNLRGIQVTAVEGIEYLNAADATTRFGTGFPRGAILVQVR